MLWYKFLDDIFTVWDGPPDLLVEFMTLTNKKDYITFIFNYDPQQVPSLDLLIQHTDDFFLSSSLYRKETAENLILHLIHPLPLKKLIPYSQFLRI